MKLMNITTLVIAILITAPAIVFAQARDPRLSSQTAARYDEATIDSNIADSRDIMYFSQMGVDQGTNAETIDLANEVLEGFTGVLYSFEQLAVAGGKVSQRKDVAYGTFEGAAAFNDKLSQARGFSFDTTWAGGMLRLHQFKLEALTLQKEFVTNGRLKTAVTEALPVVRRNITKLNTYQKKLVKKDQQEKKEAARRAKENK